MFILTVVCMAEEREEGGNPPFLPLGKVYMLTTGCGQNKEGGKEELLFL